MYKVRDHYSQKAQKEGFKARSVYKLQEIQKDLKLFKPGQTVLDLGCAPGSWSQWVSQLIGANGFIFGIDLKPVDIKLSNAEFVVGDIFNLDELKLTNAPYDIVLSDMAPATTGNATVDQARSLALCETALEIACQHLKPKGHLVVKFFMSGDYQALLKAFRANFLRVRTIRPDSTRKTSTEVFLVGIELKTSEMPHL